MFFEEKLARTSLRGMAVTRRAERSEATGGTHEVGLTAIMGDLPLHLAFAAGREEQADPDRAYTK